DEQDPFPPGRARRPVSLNRTNAARGSRAVIGYVVDASVAAKWCLPPRGETLVEESLRLLGEFTAGRVRLFVPDLFWPELGTIFWKAVRRERLSRESAAEAIHTMSELPIPTLPTLPLL